ncbi:hypothetical protein T190115A13A_30114 [Tenacibaculum sp. 190524A02b]|uniref:Secreted protein n=1 Tax=Tenacibaculum vairaonense TaxID=3137860 RepID=A0ABM9PNF9_9FLAO
MYICIRLVKVATGALAQLVEQRTENPCVPGSIPGGTTKIKLMILNCELYIKATKLSTNGALAQLVEQRTENPCVPGSIPGGTTTKTQTFKFGFFG